jgi:hypothetical protein
MLLFALFVAKNGAHIRPVCCLFAWVLVMVCTKKRLFAGCKLLYDVIVK